jgi:hypothetical protein
MPRLIRTFVLLAAFSLAAINNAARAGDARADRSSELSPAALGADTTKSSKTDADKPDLKIPNSIRLGDQTLSFDTDRKSVDSIPRVGVDAQPHVLNQRADDDSVKPGYFGLKLSVPTH